MGALPYKYQVIKKILEERGYHLEIQNFYKPRTTRYYIVDNDSEKVVITYVTLNQIRWILTILQYDLEGNREIIPMRYYGREIEILKEEAERGGQKWEP